MPRRKNCRKASKYLQQMDNMINGIFHEPPFLLLFFVHLYGQKSLRNGVKISFQFQANYFGVSQLSFEANSRAI